MAGAIKKMLRNNTPFFSVKREKLYRKDGTDTRYDALYRKDDGSQLSVVSRDYKLITHRQVVDFVHNTLRDLNIKYKVGKSEVASNGAKMFHVIRFPDYKFNVAGNCRGENTALDGKKTGMITYRQLLLKTATICLPDATLITVAIVLCAVMEWWSV
jgi:hypothetical protein